MNAEELLEFIRRKGETFESEKYKKQLEELLSEVDRIVRNGQRKEYASSSYDADRDSVSGFLQNLAELDADSYCNLGFRACKLEHYGKKIKELFGGLWVVALGKSLLMDDKNALTYVTIANVDYYLSRERILDNENRKKLFEMAKQYIKETGTELDEGISERLEELFQKII